MLTCAAGIECVYFPREEMVLSGSFKKDLRIVFENSSGIHILSLFFHSPSCCRGSNRYIKARLYYRCLKNL